MKCEQIQELLPLHAYGDLDAVDAAAEVAGHLEFCEACGREFDTLRRVRGQLDELPATATTFSISALVAKAAADDSARDLAR